MTSCPSVLLWSYHGVWTNTFFISSLQNRGLPVRSGLPIGIGADMSLTRGGHTMSLHLDGLLIQIEHPKTLIHAIHFRILSPTPLATGFAPCAGGTLSTSASSTPTLDLEIRPFSNIVLVQQIPRVQPACRLLATGHTHSPHACNFAPPPDR